MEAHEVQSFDAAGNLVRNREAAKEAILAAAQLQPQAARTSCWELSNGAVKVMIEIETTQLLFDICTWRNDTERSLWCPLGNSAWTVHFLPFWRPYPVPSHSAPRGHSAGS
jgi:hypothetical protein